MLDVFLSALSTLLTWHHILYMLIGIGMGMIVGILPALGGIAGMSLIIPFIYGMEPSAALALMVGLLAIIPTSDTFASVLMGIPGSTASQATILDGFPLSKKGEAARALSAAFAASMFGGIFGAIVLTGAVVIARPLILSFGSAELFMLALFGLSMIGVLSGNSLGKGVAACALGLALGSLGMAPAHGTERFTFGSLYLLSGVPLIVVALGTFALPEIVDLLRSDSSIASDGKLGKGWRQGLRDVWKSRWLALRCAGLGSLIGIIPGLGGSVVDWLAYGHAVQTTKDRDNFGKGDIRGVIAPESANNACAGGALVPTLLFGIPGSGSMAIFLAAMILIGIQPGPGMADPARDLNLTYIVIWTLALANVVGAGFCLLVAPGIARLTTVDFKLFAPFMIVVISFGALQATRSLGDMVALLIIGVVGIFLKRFGWSRPAFLIGFVLAPQVETYLYQAVQFTGWDFLLKPMVLGIMALTAISVWFGMRKNPSDANERALDIEGGGEHTVATNLIPQILFTAAVVLGFGYIVWASLDLPFLDKVFPLTVGIVGALGAFFVLVPQWRVQRGGGQLTSPANFDADAKTTDNGQWHFMAWLVGFGVMIWGLGFVLAQGLFFMAFLRIVARSGWLRAVILTAIALALIVGVAGIFNMQLPRGILQDHFPTLPWPIN